MRRPGRASSTAISRRGFLGGAGALAAGALRSQVARADAAQPPRPSGDFFALGVASGDPVADGFVLWTRLALDPLAEGGGMLPEPVAVDWQVALDERLRRVVRRGTATA